MICIPIVETTVKKALDSIKNASKLTDILELRVDYIKNIDENKLAALLKNKKSKVIVTCRKKSEGGNSIFGEKKRIWLLKKAIELGADFVDIEYSTDKKLIADLVKNKKNTKIICSYHDFKKTPGNLGKVYRKIKTTRCDIVKIVPFANSINDNFKVLELLKKSDGELIAFCMGKAGEISRLMCLKYNSVLTFASLADNQASAPGQIPISEMIGVYGADKINENTTFLGIMGNPVEHSKSPRFHNIGFQKDGLNFVYLKLNIENLGKFMKYFRHYFYGASVTTPYKVKIMDYLDKIESAAKKIGAVNTILNKRGILIGYNTDCEAAILSLKKKTPLKNKTVAVIGAGGASRAICFGLKNEGAKIIILNRNIKKAKALASEVGCDFSSLKKAGSIKFSILINTTSVGMWPRINESLIDKNHLKNKIVFDIIYNPAETKLIKDSRKQGSIVITGRQMFMHQARLQYKLWTGKEFPYKEVGLWQ